MALNMFNVFPTGYKLSYLLHVPLLGILILFFASMDLDSNICLASPTDSSSLWVEVYYVCSLNPYWIFL